MRLPKLAKSNAGFTIIEVLISSVVFMIGFSMMIALLNGTLAKFSTKEALAGSAVGHQIMLATLASADSTPCDSIVQNSGFHFRVVRDVNINGRIAKVNVVVYRLKKTKEIVRYYDELALPQE